MDRVVQSKLKKEKKKNVKDEETADDGEKPKKEKKEKKDKVKEEEAADDREKPKKEKKEKKDKFKEEEAADDGEKLKKEKKEKKDKVKDEETADDGEKPKKEKKEKKDKKKKDETVEKTVLTSEHFLKLEKLADQLNEAVKSLSDGTSQPVVKYDVVLDKFNAEGSKDIISCLARHEISINELKDECPITLSSEMGLIDATILTDMLRNINGTSVSLNEHRNKDGNLALIDLIQESAALSNSMVELLN